MGEWYEYVNVTAIIVHSQILQALQKVMVSLYYYYYNPQNPGDLEVGEGL